MNKKLINVKNNFFENFYEKLFAIKKLFVYLQRERVTKSLQENNNIETITI